MGQSINTVSQNNVKGPEIRPHWDIDLCAGTRVGPGMTQEKIQSFPCHALGLVIGLAVSEILGKTIRGFRFSVFEDYDTIVHGCCNIRAGERSENGENRYAEKEIAFLIVFRSGI